MKKQLAIFLIIFFNLKSVLSGYYLETNASYDYFRGLPDGSWNGNSGAVIGANGAISLFDCANLQLGGSYGNYNWDGRGNVVFANPKRTTQMGFVTAGGAFSYDNFKVGLVVDSLFAKNFSIYCQDPSLYQLRFKGGYSLCSDELGIWGTYDLNRSHKTALGLPVTYQAICQLNLFWSHYFENCAETSVWIGMPYNGSLLHSHGRAGNFITGFTVKVPLTAQLWLDGYGSYMFARKTHGVTQSRNYGSSICIGLTYLFSGNRCCESPYLPIADHSNFLVDISSNQ